jgi:DMSO/TMAO reductase YedYZ molybdopterin-dependent catalytic subunit
MRKKEFTRRDFLKATGVVSAAAAAGVGALPIKLLAAEKPLVRFPQKAELELLTSRPPQLETPISYFRELITPNEALFVRWHISGIPTRVDPATWRLNIGGHVERPLALSLDELRSRFRPISYTAVIQCSGNGRSFADPRVPGGQWGNGAMGNVTWTGARLRDILDAAGLKAGAVDVSFNGLDTPPLPSVPDLVKSLPVDEARGEDIMVAYEMNGSALPVLNGYPVRLVVPGWFATYWVKSLSDITVLDKPFEGFWVKTAYRIPATPCGCVAPGSKPEKTVPINRMVTRSLIVTPTAGERVRAGKEVQMMGVAFSGGVNIRDVIVSVDGGSSSWREAKLGKDLGKYSWRQWTFPWRPQKPGTYTLMARATDAYGESQPFESLWNPGGYLYNKIERVEITAV